MRACICLASLRNLKKGDGSRFQGSCVDFPNGREGGVTIRVPIA
jgi:hypothetical protein